MKKLSIVILSLFFINILFSQESENDSIPPPPVIYEFVGEMAEFPGGLPALYQLLGSSIVYPEKCAKKNI